jgi:hypothetical protein
MGMIKNKYPQKGAFLGTIKGGWKKISAAVYNAIVGKAKWLLGAVLSVFLVVGCKTPFYLPSETTTQVNLKDSTVLHIKDSIRIHEATRYKDLAWLGDTLKIEGSRSSAWAYADTTKECLTGGLEEKPYEEKTKIIYKDRWKVRDSLVFKEKPYPVEVEVEKKVTPKWSWYSLILNIFMVAGTALFIILKIKKTL